jgi:hypothetical protein
MKMIHETHEKHERKIKIIRVNSCNSWVSFFYTSQGEAPASLGTPMKKVHRLHNFTQIIKKIKNQCNQCNLWTSFFHRLWVRPRHHDELTLNPGSDSDRNYVTSGHFTLLSPST